MRKSRLAGSKVNRKSPARQVTICAVMTPGSVRFEIRQVAGTLTTDHFDMEESSAWIGATV